MDGARPNLRALFKRKGRLVKDHWKVTHLPLRLIRTSSNDLTQSRLLIVGRNRDENATFRCFYGLHC